MVFETRHDVIAFREACRQAGLPVKNRLIALDGYRYNIRPVRPGEKEAACMIVASLVPGAINGG